MIICYFGWHLKHMLDAFPKILIIWITFHFFDFPTSLKLLLLCRHALNVQIFLKMHRSDYAEKQLKIMQQIDEDHTLTQLANAWLDLAVVITFFLSLLLLTRCCRALTMINVVMSCQGGSKIQEAYLIFQDFSEKYQQTGIILNGKAVCSMHMGRFEDAESLLLEALNKAKFDLS